MSLPQGRQADHQSRALALDHVWKWYGFWNHLAFQIINIYVILAAFMTAGYVSTFSAHLHVASAAIALGGLPVTWAAYDVVRRHVGLATRAEAPMAEIRDQLAQQLDIDSLRMIAPTSAHTPSWIAAGRHANVSVAFVSVLCLVAAAVALATS